MFDFSKDYILEDDRALLRPMQTSDVPHLLPFSLHEPELWQYSIVSAAGEEALKSYMNTTLQRREISLDYPFIVFDKKAGCYAGCTRFHEFQKEHRTVNLGYTWYGKVFQRTGLNRHGKFLMLQFAFEKLGMERVEFRADINNQRSIEAMKGIGCKEEGIFRSHLINPDGSRRSSLVLSILQEEWQNEVKNMLAQKTR